MNDRRFLVVLGVMCVVGAIFGTVVGVVAEQEGWPFWLAVLGVTVGMGVFNIFVWLGFGDWVSDE